MSTPIWFFYRLFDVRKFGCIAVVVLIGRLFSQRTTPEQIFATRLLPEFLIPGVYCVFDNVWQMVKMGSNFSDVLAFSGIIFSCSGLCQEGSSPNLMRTHVVGISFTLDWTFNSLNTNSVMYSVPEYAVHMDAWKRFPTYSRWGDTQRVRHLFFGPGDAGSWRQREEFCRNKYLNDKTKFSPQLAARKLHAWQPRVQLELQLEQYRHFSLSGGLGGCCQARADNYRGFELLQ